MKVYEVYEHYMATNEQMRHGIYLSEKKARQKAKELNDTIGEEYGNPIYIEESEVIE